jgi:hypothetical protein
MSQKNTDRDAIVCGCGGVYVPAGLSGFFINDGYTGSELTVHFKCVNCENEHTVVVRSSPENADDFWNGTLLLRQLVKLRLRWELSTPADRNRQ